MSRTPYPVGRRIARAQAAGPFTGSVGLLVVMVVVVVVLPRKNETAVSETGGRRRGKSIFWKFPKYPVLDSLF